MGGIQIAEIILLVVSVACFVVSFLIPEKKREGSGIDQELAMQEVRGMMENEMENLREPLNKMATEYVGYAYDNVTKELDDTFNEKSFEFTNYSDTVMRELKKEEEEVVLLHQAVKDEKDNLKKTVVAAGKAAKAMRESIEKIQTMRPVQVSYGAGSVKIAPMTSSGNTGTEVKKQDQTK